jgi:hypothetical protein
MALLWKHAVAVLFALIILFEEWGWEPLSRGVGALAALPAIARLERWISQLSPPGAMAALVLPWTFLVPIKILTLWLLATGQFALAMTALVAGKVIGTAVIARLFTLTKPSLMQMSWFADWYDKWTVAKNYFLAQARATATWTRLRLFKRRLRRWTRRAAPATPVTRA